MPSLQNLPPTPHPTLLGCNRAPQFIQKIPTGLCFTCGHVYVSMPLSPFIPFAPSPPPPPRVHKSVLYVCVSIADLRIGKENILNH